jgi:hypothetical protein
MARTRVPLRHKIGEYENREQDDVTDRQPSLEHGSKFTADETTVKPQQYRHWPCRRFTNDTA